MEHINRKELVEAIATTLTEVKKKDIEEVVVALFDELKKTLVEGKSVQINRFGTFKVVTAKERNGVNPKTGEKMVIPAKQRISFTASKALKESVQ